MNESGFELRAVGSQARACYTVRWELEQVRLGNGEAVVVRLLCHRGWDMMNEGLDGGNRKQGGTWETPPGAMGLDVKERENTLSHLDTPLPETPLLPSGSLPMLFFHVIDFLIKPPGVVERIVAPEWTLNLSLLRHMTLYSCQTLKAWCPRLRELWENWNT